MTELAKGCSHLQEFKQSTGLHSYQVIYKYLVKPQISNSEARKLKVCLVIECVTPFIHTLNVNPYARTDDF